MSDVDVLYITGAGRSGSTLLANLLGSTDGMFSAGELRFLWDRGLLEDRRCGCSRHFSECPLWSTVVSTAFDEPPDAHRMLREGRQITRVRQLPQLLGGRFGEGELRSMAGYYLDNVERLYRGLADETGCMVVDSSKLPTYCYLVDQVPSIRLRVVHLVRDPRATAHSWQRTRASRALDDDDEEMDRFNLFKASALWDIWNSAAVHLFADRSDYLQVRYEDLVSEPRKTIGLVRTFAGLPPDDEPFVDANTVRLRSNHAVAGNPNRRRNGETRLVEDDEWRTALGPIRRATITALTAPVLGRFGYPWSTRRSMSS